MDLTLPLSLGWATVLKDLICSIYHFSYQAVVRGELFGKAVYAVFWPLPGSIRMGLGPGLLPYQEMSPHILFRVYCLMWKYLSWFRLSVCSLFCLSMWLIWYLANPTTKYVLTGRDRVLSSVVQEGCMQGNRSVLTAGRGLLAIGDWYTLLKLILLCPFLYVSKALFHPVLDYVDFLSDPDIKMQLAEVFKVLLLETGNRHHLLAILEAKEVFSELKRNRIWGEINIEKRKWGGLTENNIPLKHFRNCDMRNQAQARK